MSSQGSIDKFTTFFNHLAVPSGWRKELRIYPELCVVCDKRAGDVWKAIKFKNANSSVLQAGDRLRRIDETFFRKPQG